MYISADLSWLTHCDYVIKKANRRLYALRKLKGCGVPQSDIVITYCSLVHSVLKYAFVNFCKFATVSLSGSREGAKESSRHNFRLCFELRTSSGQSGYNVLEDRRGQACHKFVINITPESVFLTLNLKQKCFQILPHILSAAASSSG